MQLIITLAFMAFVTQSQAQLECYVCNDCRGLPDNIQRTACAGQGPTTTTAPPLTPPVELPTPSLTPATTTIEMTPPPLPSFYEKSGPLVRQRRQAQDPWQCFQIEVRVGENDIHSRGCVQRSATEALTCQAANNGIAPQWCELCDSDGCNSAISHTLSLAALITSIVLALKLF